jgi:hypothetical protein
MSAAFNNYDGPLTQILMYHRYNSKYDVVHGLHCKEDPIYVFPKMKLRALVSGSDLYIPTIGLSILHICFEFSVQCLCSVCGYGLRHQYLDTMYYTYATRFRQGTDSNA